MRTFAQAVTIALALLLVLASIAVRLALLFGALAALYYGVQYLAARV